MTYEEEVPYAPIGDPEFMPLGPRRLYGEHAQAIVAILLNHDRQPDRDGKGEIPMTPDQIEEFRAWCKRYGGGEKYGRIAESSDADIEEAVETARDWIRGRRWSTTIVAANYLLDGYCHP